MDRGKIKMTHQQHQYSSFLNNTFTGVFPRDLLSMMCGDRLGAGMSREVYVFAPQPSLVIKIETGDRHQNVLEWETWNRVKWVDDVKDWFAPCVMLSPYGQFLLQKRTTPTHDLPDKVPAFITDTKAGNFGIYDGRVVAHDYAINLLMEKGMTKRFHKAHWNFSDEVTPPCS